MKKFRYGDPSKVSFFGKYSGFIYFFTAWNVFAVTVWQVINLSKSKKDENWNQKSANKRYMDLMGFDDKSKQCEHINIKGLHYVERDKESGAQPQD